MARDCRSCERSWPSSATFCGSCGALLDPSLAAVPEDARPVRLQLPPRLGWLAAAVLAIAAAVAVPTLSVERDVPVVGEVGVPEDDELQAAPVGAPPRPRRAPAPEVTCTVDGEPRPCLRWSRELLPSQEPGGGWPTWPVAIGDRLLLVGPDAVEAIDAEEGTRLWRTPLDGAQHVLDANAEVAVVTSDQDVTVVDLDTGGLRWTARRSPVVWGDVLVDDVVITADGPRTLVGHDRDDGAPRWRWQAPWSGGTGVRHVDDDRLLVHAGDGAEGLALLDARTGAELARLDRDVGWVLEVVDDVAVALVAPDRHRPGRAGDPGATLVGVDLADLTVRWEQDVPSSEGSFPVVDGVVLAPSTGRLTAYEATTGEVAWALEVPSTTEVLLHGQGWGPGAPRGPLRTVVTHDRAGDVVEGHDPRSGALLWTRPVEVDMEFGVLGPEGLLLQGADTVLVIDAVTGRERVRVDVPLTTSVLALDPPVLVHPPSGHLVRLTLP